MSDMPDPLQLYPHIFKNTPFEQNWKESLISIPNIRDGNGHLISPYEYRSKLMDKSIVNINVQLKLYASFFISYSLSINIY
jgi:hypothetical protein